MKIQITELNYNILPCNRSSYTNDWGIKKSFNAFKVKETSGSKVYITVLDGEMKLSTIGKLMEFKEGSIIIKFGKQQIVIGKYNKVA
ncbi:hypothetical protein [Paenibacillus tianjinensis]|uniref:Uncharacterized protein n=1 Tax=Paenibacillus tianjinensis TaxID=2810347 RepID=A0ABX7L5X0_9BACL|nr:hypothetical protein [Paenibacillus tianjinensis]QSF43512.1 hypothetical protein JRJ22_19815 [Paenibacillus tianjinensis]